MKKYIVFVIFILFIIYDFPIIYYPIYNNDPCKNPYTIRIDDDILFISDVHLKGNENYTFIGEYLKKMRIKNLVIVGDLFYKKSVKLSEEDILKILGLNSNITVIFVKGNHDPSNLNFSKMINAGECLKILSNNHVIYATHGHHSSRIGAIGFLLKYLGIDVQLIWKRVMKINEWVIFGHLHIPEINYNDKYARCGSFINRLFIDAKPYGILFNKTSFRLIYLIPTNLDSTS